MITVLEAPWTINRKPVLFQPEQSGMIIATGTVLNPEWRYYNPEELEISGITQAVLAGTYEAVFTPRSNYCWPDGGTEPRAVQWKIMEKALSVPEQSGTLIYSGATQTPTWTSFDPSQMTISGETAGSDAGEYVVTFVPSGDLLWDDGTNDPKEVTWVIGRQPLITEPNQDGTVVFSGSSQSPQWHNYSSAQLNMTGQTSGTDAGTYTVVFTPTNNYCWSDGGTGAVEVTWKIDRQPLTALPSQSGTLTYTGNELTPTWTNYSSTYLTLGGTVKGTNANTYDAEFTPTANYCWSDGLTNTRTVQWIINKAAQVLSWSVTYPRVIKSGGTTTWTVTRSENAVLSVESSDTSKVTVSVSGATVTVTGGATLGAATITVTAAETANYNAATKTQTITNCEQVTLPAQSGTLTYTAKSQAPTWNSNYSSARFTISGTTTGTNAGTYTATFTPNANYCWSDKTQTAKNASWTIGKASLTLSVDPTTLYLGGKKTTGTITAKVAGLGTSVTTAVSHTTTYASNSRGSTTTGTTYSQNVYTFTNKRTTGSGSLTATFGLNSNSNTVTTSVNNVTIPATKTATIYTYPNVGLNNSAWTPALIKGAVQAGQASNFWTVGQNTIAVSIKGDTYTNSFDGNYSCTYLGPHYRYTNSAVFRWAATGTTSIAFWSSPWNLTATTTGGYKESYMCKTTLGAFQKVLETTTWYSSEAWQHITMYEDSGTTSHNTQADVKLNSYGVWLEAEYEVFGWHFLANPYEQNYQSQFAFYANGNNPKMKSQYLDATARYLRSCTRGTGTACFVNDNGEESSKTADNSLAYAPCMCVK